MLGTQARATHQAKPLGRNGAEKGPGPPPEAQAGSPTAPPVLRMAEWSGPAGEGQQ